MSRSDIVRRLRKRKIGVLMGGWSSVSTCSTTFSVEVGVTGGVAAVPQATTVAMNAHRNAPTRR